MGTADEEQAVEVGEWPNDTLTFELETIESIVIKLFICLFTVKNRGEEVKEEQEEGGGRRVRKTIMR